MRKNRYSGRCGLEVMHDMIRLNIGYGRVFSRKDLLMPMACTQGLNLSEGVSTDDLLEDMVKYSYLREIPSEREKKYLLVRTDKRTEPIVGFNPHKS